MWRRGLWPWRRLILVPKASYKRLAHLEARLADLAGEATESWLDLATLSDDELLAVAAYHDKCDQAGGPLPLPAELEPINRRLLTDPALAEVRQRAGWFVAGRDWGQVWRALV